MNTEHSIIAQSDMRCACIYLGLTSEAGSELDSLRLQRTLGTIQAARDLHVFRVAGATAAAQESSPGFVPASAPVSADVAGNQQQPAAGAYGIGRHNDIQLQIQSISEEGDRLEFQADGVKWAVWASQSKQIVRQAGVGGIVTGNGVGKAGKQRGVLYTFYPDGGS